MATIELKEQEWKEFSQAEFSIIDCYGDFCSACVLLEPVFDGLADELAGIAFGRINITQYPEIADAYGIDALPTILFFRKGQLVDTQVGSMEREELLLKISEFLYQ